MISSALVKVSILVHFHVGFWHLRPDCEWEHPDQRLVLGTVSRVDESSSAPKRPKYRRQKPVVKPEEKPESSLPTRKRSLSDDEDDDGDDRRCAELFYVHLVQFNTVY